jgi:hypothetical protein
MEQLLHTAYRSVPEHGHVTILDEPVSHAA